MKYLWFILVAGALSISISGCEYDYAEMPEEEIQPIAPVVHEPETTITQEGFEVYNNVQPAYYGADPSRPVALVNNEAATNPTWRELKSYLLLDTTDQNMYSPGIRVCAEFAMELHNNAEKAGIRTAWVAIEFEDEFEGHALNAFETTDMGLVFIDCTGGIPVIQIPTVDTETGEIVKQDTCFDSHDKKAFLEIGKPYGSIPIEVASDFGYKAYQIYLSRWDKLDARLEAYVPAVEEYNLKVNEYNSYGEEYELLLGGRTEIQDEAEYRKLSDMYNELEITRLELEKLETELRQESYLIHLESEELGRCKREELGIVRSVEIYW